MDGGRKVEETEAKSCTCWECAAAAAAGYVSTKTGSYCKDRYCRKDEETVLEVIDNGHSYPLAAARPDAAWNAVTSAWDSIVSVIPTPSPPPETEDRVSWEWAQQLNDFLEDVTGLDLDGDGKVGGAPIPSPKAEQEPSVKSDGLPKKGSKGYIPTQIRRHPHLVSRFQEQQELFQQKQEESRLMSAPEDDDNPMQRLLQKHSTPAKSHKHRHHALTPKQRLLMLKCTICGGTGHTRHHCQKECDICRTRLPKVHNTHLCPVSMICQRACAVRVRCVCVCVVAYGCAWCLRRT